MERKDWNLCFTDWFSWWELMEIYTNDKNTQSLLLQQLSQIEVSIVAIIVRMTTSEWWSHWIYDEQYYNKNTLFYQWIQDFTTNIEWYKRRHDSIKLYYDKWYDDPLYPPVRNVIEILSLWQISKMLISLSSSMKKKIAKEYNLPSPVLCNWLEWLTQIRNIAAHNDVLYQYHWLKQLQSYRHIGLSPDKNLLEDYQKVVTYLLDIIRG